MLVNISFISLVNIILKKGTVKELIQNDLTEKNLENELSNLLNDNRVSYIINEYSKIYFGEENVYIKLTLFAAISSEGELNYIIT